MKYCTACGTPMADEAKFCTACGTAIRAVGGAQPQPAPSAPPAVPKYDGYTAKEVRKDLRKNLVGIIFLILPLLIGVGLVCGTVADIITVQIESVSDISYETMQEIDRYYFDELVVVDSYAYNGIAEGYARDHYFLVRFQDGNGTWVYATFKPGVSGDEGELRDQCEAYLKDDSQEVGDLVLSGCFYGTKDHSTDCYFERGYEKYNAETPGEALKWELHYDDAKTAEEYREREVSQKCYTFFPAGIILLPSVIGFVYSARKRKTLKQYLAEAIDAGNL